MLVRGAGKHLADCAGAGPHRVQVDVAVGVVVGREGKQREVGLADVRVVGRRAQAVAAACRDEVVEARLADRCLAGVDGRSMSTLTTAWPASARQAATVVPT